MTLSVDMNEGIQQLEPLQCQVYVVKRKQNNKYTKA